MNKLEGEVAEHLNHLIDSRGPARGKEYKILDVDKDTMECTVQSIIDENEVLYQVNLKAQTGKENQNGFIQIPKKGSIVLVSPIDLSKYNRFCAGDYYISMFSEIDEILFIQRDYEVFKIDKEGMFSYKNKNKENVFEMKSDGQVLFHKGENLGMVRVGELVNKLNAIEDQVNNLLEDYKSHNHNYIVDGVTMTTTSLNPPQLSALTKTKVEDIENEKVKH